MIDLANNEARYLALLYRQMMKRLDRELTPLKIGPGRYAYLFGLYLQDGRKQQELADVIGADKAAATRALSRLEKDGYVRRTVDPEDRRVMRVFLTPKGRKLRPTLEAAAETCMDAITNPLNEKERSELKSLLAKMVLPFVR